MSYIGVSIEIHYETMLLRRLYPLSVVIGTMQISDRNHKHIIVEAPAGASSTSPLWVRFRVGLGHTLCQHWMAIAYRISLTKHFCVYVCVVCIFVLHVSTCLIWRINFTLCFCQEEQVLVFK